MSDKVRFYLLLGLFVASIALLVYAHNLANQVAVR
jgi:NADH:ubiquinone oxidoreductase subunit 5 (subunit L)/multisubunit Na+/H+ antiporter MnhA subunit